MLFYGWISKKNNLVKYRSNEHDDNFEKKKKNNSTTVAQFGK